MSESKSLKKDLRSRIVAETNARSADECAARSAKIQNQLQQFVRNHSGYWGSFKSLHSEPQVNFEQLKNIKCCYPKVSGDDLEFYADVKTWSTSSLKVSEPMDGKKVSIKDLSGIFVPALAFHADGHRLGRGKGYYDRTLASFTGHKVGVCYHFNILSSVPTESHDVGMDYIVTDETVFNLHSKNKSGDQKSWN